MALVELTYYPNFAIQKKPLRFSSLLSKRFETIEHIFAYDDSVRFGMVTVHNFSFPLIVNLEKLDITDTQVRSEYLGWLFDRLSFLSLVSQKNGKLRIEGIDIDKTRISDAYSLPTWIEMSSFADVIYALLGSKENFEPVAVTCLIMAIAPRLLAKLNIEYEAYLSGE